MPQFDVSTYPSQIFWLCISFFTMLFIMSKFVVPRINEILNQRQRKIDDYLSAAHEFTTQAEEVINRYEEALEKAEIKAQAAMNEAKKNMEDFVEQAKKEADKRLQMKFESSEKKIADIQKEAYEKVESISVEIAVEILNKIDLAIPKSEIMSVMYQDTINE